MGLEGRLCGTICHLAWGSRDDALVCPALCCKHPSLEAAGFQAIPADMTECREGGDLPPNK